MGFKRLQFGFLLLLAAIVLPGCATKSLQKMTDQELTKMLMERSGVATSLTTLPQSVDEGLEKQRDKFKSQPEIYELMVKSFREAFEPNRLLKNMEDEINLKLNRQDKLAVLEWYEQSLGRKAYLMEGFMDTQQGQDAFNTFIDSFEKDNKTPDRELLEFAAKLARETHALQIMVDTMSSVSLGLLTGFNGILPEKQRMNIFEIDQRILTIRQHLSEQLAPSIVLVLAFTYKDLNQEERAQLLAFYSRGVGRKYITTLSQGMSSNLERAAMRVGDGVARGVADLPEKSTSGRAPASIKK
ncbi:MAG: hypothetical protein HYV97_05155 [Bdellovibrio sp.]|nr:hypothetical protein [Bdellovibrio sp.]